MRRDTLQQNNEGRRSRVATRNVTGGVVAAHRATRKSLQNNTNPNSSLLCIPSLRLHPNPPFFHRKCSVITKSPNFLLLWPQREFGTYYVLETRRSSGSHFWRRAGMAGRVRRLPPSPALAILVRQILFSAPPAPWWFAFEEFSLWIGSSSSSSSLLDRPRNSNLTNNTPPQTATTAESTRTVVSPSIVLVLDSASTTPNPITNSIMPTTYLKIATPMVCGGCTGTVEKALMAVPGVSGVSVSLDSKAAKVHVANNAIVAAESLVAATAAVGFDSTVGSAADFTCGSSKAKSGGGPCGHPNCTCGHSCQCGSTCNCAGCPGSVCGAGKAGKAGACGKIGCTCTNCQCGTTCGCTSCQSPVLAYLTSPTNLAMAAALIAVGFLAATKLVKK
jgi:copper chaperone CopZ